MIIGVCTKVDTLFLSVSSLLLVLLVSLSSLSIMLLSLSGKSLLTRIII